MAMHKEDRLGDPQGRAANQSCQQPMLEHWEGNSSSTELNTTALSEQQLQHQLLRPTAHGPDKSVTQLQKVQLEEHFVCQCKQESSFSQQTPSPRTSSEQSLMNLEELS